MILFAQLFLQLLRELLSESTPGLRADLLFETVQDLNEKKQEKRLSKNLYTRNISKIKKTKRLCT